MRFKHIKIKDFTLFRGEHSLSLDDQGLVLLSGKNNDETGMDSNGAGKSYFFDAIDWCCFGVHPRGDHVDAVINRKALHEGKAEARVDLLLEDEQGMAIRIVRTRKRGKTTLVFKVGGVDKTRKDVRETQKLVEEVLGIDRAVFQSTIMFGQFDLIRYADATDAARMSVLTKLLELEAIDRCLACVKERKGQLSTYLVDLNAYQVGKEQAHNQAEMALTSARVKADSFEDDKTDQIALLANTVTATEANLVQKRAELQERDSLLEARKQVQVAQAMLMAPPDFDSSECNQQLSELDQRILSNVGEAAKLEGELQAQGQLASGVCPLCKTPVDLGQHQVHTAELNQALGQLQETGQRLQQEKASVQSRIQVGQAESRVNQQKYRDLNKRSQDQLTGIDERLLYLEQTVGKEVAGLESDLANYRGQIDQLRASENPFNSQVAEQTQIVAVLAQEVEEAKARAEATRREEAHVDFWVEGFGKKGLKSYIMDQRIQELSEAANKWLSVLTHGTFWVEFQTEKTTRTNQVVNAPEIRVFHANPDGTVVDFNYRSYSGGEKRRISFAVDFGLSMFMSRRASTSFNVLFLDEVFRNLDASGREAAIELLTAFRAHKDSIFVIEHAPDFVTSFDRQILFTKTNGDTTITLTPEEADGSESENS